MQKKTIYVAAILSLMAAYGCEDDTGGGVIGSQCVPSECASHECLDNGECKPVKTDPKPNDECKDGSCESEVTYLAEGDECTAGDKTKVCKTPLKCYEGHCTKTDDIELGKSCASDEDCADDEKFTTCMDNGHCGYIAKIGEDCTETTGGMVKCEEGTICDGVCYKILAIGDACESGDNLHVCDMANNQFCIDGTCNEMQMALGRGSECNDSYKFCASDLTCLEGFCTEIAGEEEPCDPDVHLICPETMACIKGKCEPVMGNCTKTSDCTEKDTFCCTNESCGAVGKCIPYNEEVTHDETCRFKTKPGIFEAQIQCRWQPNDGVEKGSTKVEMPPLVGHFGNKSGLKTIIAVYSYSPTVIRFIDPENCDTLESLKVGLTGRWSNYPAAADLDGDGYMEFITSLSSNTAVAYRWDEAQQKHVEMWHAHNDANKNNTSSNGPIMVYDVNGDGKPEVIAGTTVINGQTGLVMFSGSNGSSNTFSIGNFDNDPNGYASQLRNDGIWKWDNDNQKWVQKLKMSGQGHTAYADFGTPGATAADFDYTKLDGKPEYVFSGGSKLLMFADHVKDDGSHEAQQLMSVTGYSTGGPVTIGDFNNDGLPEIGIASSGLFGVYDPKCKAYEVGRCADQYVMWERWSQDASSGSTGSSLFDFDGDGQSEAVYADECFTRVYDGKTGRVLFSARRSSDTSIEAPVIADVDGDGSAEIIMGSDNNQSCDSTDQIHEGIRCEVDEDCPNSIHCETSVGLCVCTKDTDCNTQYITKTDGTKVLVDQYVCTNPIHPDSGFKRNTNGKGRAFVKTKGSAADGNPSYKVCRATRKTTNIGTADMMIFKDRLDRWVSSRTMWSQHAYNIININDDGTIADNATWLDRWRAKLTDKTIDGTSYPRPKYNNYRLNSQGEYGAGMAPDITGRFNPGSICGTTSEGKYVISGKLCNRGTKPAGKDLPASFFYLNDDGTRGERICTSYTTNVFGVGECDNVGCVITETQLKELEGKKVMMVSNLDEFDHNAIVECNESNNTDTTTIDKCEAEIVIVN